MIAVGFFAVGRALCPTHRKIGDAESRNIRKVVDGVVEQCNAVAENAAENFGDDQAERKDHGPAKNGRLESGMSVAGVRVGMTGAAVVLIVAMAVRMPGHDPILRRSKRLAQPLDRKSTRLNSSHVSISYAVFCLKKKKNKHIQTTS